MPSASDVPGKYDLLLNSQGYVFNDTIDTNLPFRTARAIYTYSPTFVNRQNVSGNFGDDQQDFWLTSSQNDWSEGEQQKFFRQGDQDSRSKYWRGTNLDLSIQGQAKISPATVALTFASAANSVCYAGSNFFAGSTTNLYEVDNAGGTITDRGAHGAGGSATALAFDGQFVYVSGSAATKIRKYDTSAHTYADFSAATPAVSMAYLNNTLYGTATGGVLNRYDTAGTATAITTFKNAVGTGVGNDAVLCAFGGKLLVLRRDFKALGNELYIYDGVGVTKLYEFPPSFQADNICVSNGVIFVIGIGQKRGAGSRIELRYLANGTPGLAFASQYSSAGGIGTKRAVAAFGDGVLFTDATNSAFMYYDLAVGGASTLGSYTPSSDGYLAAGGTAAVHVQSATTGNAFFFDTAFPSTATVMTSLFDFDSSLDKYVKAVKVDFDSATDGNGGSVDISYRLNSLTGASDTYTSVQVGATAGTEYTIGQSCRSISIKVTLNKGTSTSGPILKRIYVRAAPILQQFRNRQYFLDLGGTQDLGKELRDGTYHPKTGRAQADDLITAAQLTTPFSVTDRFGTYTALIDLNTPDGFMIYEIHPSVTTPIKSGSFLARVSLREV